MVRYLRPLRWPLAVAVAASVPLWGVQSLRAQRSIHEGAWLAWGADHTFTRYSPLATITKDNVKDLQVLWRWRSADRDLQVSNPLWRSGRNEDTPLMVNGTLYAGNPAEIPLASLLEIAIVIGRPPALIPKSWAFSTPS